jgi:hypothetical protein
MSHHNTHSYRPGLEVLEDRLPPGSLGGIFEGTDRHKADEDALFQSVQSGGVSFASTSAAEHSQGHANPGVLPPQSHPFGKTYGQWEAAIWQWTFSLPADHHPLTDTAPPSTGQTDHVWFLGGTFAPTVGPGGEFIGEVTRDATIPSGTAIFFPIINVESSTLEGNGTTFAELSANSKFLADFIVPDSLFVTIDGHSVGNLTSFRSQSPLFTFGPLPDNNLLGAPAGSTSPSVSDGYHMMLAPLSVGQHTLEFGGKLVAPELNLTFIQDITYHITVTPAGKGQG